MFLGVLGTNVSYLKTKKASQPIVDTEEESADKAQFLKSSGTSILSVDSLEANGEKGDVTREVTATATALQTFIAVDSTVSQLPSHIILYDLPRESGSQPRYNVTL